MEIAATWFSVTGDVYQAERCLVNCIGFENNTRSWVETASFLRSALNIKSEDQTYSDHFRRFLLKAEELADSCADWCDCVSAWRFNVRDNERALSCLGRAEERATTFFDALLCACAWDGYDYEKVKHWVGRAAGKTVTAHTWLRCAQSLHSSQKEDPATREDIEEYLARAEAITGTFDGYIVWVSAADMCLGTRGIESVMRGLFKAESRIKDINEWCVLLATVINLRYRAQHFREPVAGIANVEELETYYKQCRKKFIRCRPKTHNWLYVTKRLYWKKPDDTEREFMAMAEASARSSQDWQDCAAQWMALKLPDSLKRAITCRLYSMKTRGRARLP